MAMSFFSAENQLRAARRVLEHLGEELDGRFSVKLWDGSVVPLGRNVDTPFRVAIASAGVVGSVLRRPTLDNALRHYARGDISLEGGNLLDFGDVARSQRGTKVLKRLSKSLLVREALPLLFARSDARDDFSFGDAGADRGEARSRQRETDFIQFHYDLGNEFYQLFLDPEMQYSCAYFRDWKNSVDQAQRDKLEMICRKLRLEKGERFLDIGCGWGGLVCHAARHHGVEAYGVTLSQEQHDFANEKIRAMGLEGQVRVELRNYMDIEGEFDKAASIGMFEHVGIANFERYFGKVNSLLRDRGVFLNHSIHNKAKKRKSRKLRPEKRFILKYIFPGSELADVGLTARAMEGCRFEIHDIEGWREHYGLTTRAWSQRLIERRDDAIRLVGPERYRLWLAYLAGVSWGFMDGSIRLYQIVATKHRGKGRSGMPPTREHLYLP